MRLAAYVAIFSFIGLLQLFCNPTAGAGSSPLRVSLEENTLSVAAENVALQTILLELAAQGITIKIDPAINHSVTANFSRRPIEQGLDTLLKPASYTLLWEAVPHKPDEAATRLAEIQIFRSGKKDLIRILPSPRNPVIAKTGGKVFYVKDEILLYLPPGTDPDRLLEAVGPYSATIVYHKGLPGLVKLQLPENSDVFAIVAEIRERLGFGLVQPNYAYPIQSPVRYPAGTMAASAVAGLYGPAADAAPVAILDSGLIEHDELEKFVLSSLDVINPGTPMADTLGHGSQMAFIVTGLVAPLGAEADSAAHIPIIPIRTFDDQGYTTDFKIMDAINFALENKARVMSISWGSETRSEFMEKAFAYANTRGLVVVASAGNEPTGTPVYPAAYSSVIGVGALGPHGGTWENSNYGNFVALYAPGFATLPVGHKGDPGLYGGTSISAAFVARTIAGYLTENPAATVQEIQDYLSREFKYSDKPQ